MASASWVAESDIMVETDVGQPGSHATVTDDGYGSEEPMALRQASPTWLLIVLSAATLPTALSVVMLGPLLVALAHEFQTSVAVAGQLAAATAITWGITAPLVGPVSDVCGRRLMLLTGLLLMAGGMLGSVLAWNYGALLACRLLTGVGAALVPPNGIAMIAEVFPPEGRGQAIGWFVTASGVGVVLGVPLVAGLLGVGGWRLPFAVVGAAVLGIWLLLWVWCPRSPRRPGQPLAFFAHYREVGAHGMVWYLLAANALQQMALLGVFSYLAAHLLHTAQMTIEDTVLPLAVAGGGLIVGGVLGGWVANHRHRLAWFALACVGSGALAALAFTVGVSPWITVALACGTAGLARISSVVTPAWLLERAGGSRTTATGVFAVSNQLGVFGGSSLGGLMLALGGFPLLGLFCLGVAIIAAAVLRFKVRESAEFLAQRVLRQDHATTSLKARMVGCISLPSLRC
jgi:MFS transporter, DHA1 family, inner membrane transport protein